MNVNPNVVGELVNDLRLELVDVNGDDGEEVHGHNGQAAGREADQSLAGNDFRSVIDAFTQTSSHCVSLVGLVPEQKIFNKVSYKTKSNYLAKNVFLLNSVTFFRNVTDWVLSTQFLEKRNGYI